MSELRKEYERLAEAYRSSLVLYRDEQTTVNYRATQAARAALDALFERLVADSECIEWLERFAHDEGGIVLHNGGEWTHGRLPYPGLGLDNTGRNLRQAVDAARTTQEQTK